MTRESGDHRIPLFKNRVTSILEICEAENLRIFPVETPHQPIGKRPLGFPDTSELLGNFATDPQRRQALRQCHAATIGLIMKKLGVSDVISPVNQ